jgi:hypothetical protein
MANKYEIHFDQTGKIKPLSESFNDFTPFLAFIKANRTDAWAGRVKIHLPAGASEEERAAIRNLGLSAS